MKTSARYLALRYILWIRIKPTNIQDNYKNIPYEQATISC